MTPEAGKQDEARSTTARALPRRFWWLKRLMLGVLAFALALLALRLGWGWYAESRLQAAIARLRAAGEPVFPEDFGQADAVYEDSAAQWLELAAREFDTRVQAVRQGRGQRRAGDVPARIDFDYTNDELEPLLQDPALVRDFLTVYELSLRMFHTAAQKPYVVWPALSASGPARVRLYSLEGLAQAACLAALATHTAGDESSWLIHLEDVLANARHLQAIEPSTLAYVMRPEWENCVAWALERILPNLQIADGRDYPGNSADTRARLDGIRHRLLDEAEHEAGRRLAALGERAFQLDACRDLISGMPSVAGSGMRRRLICFWVSPAWKLDALRILGYADQRMRAEGAPNWPTAASLLPKEEWADWHSSPTRIAHIPSMRLVSGWSPDTLKRQYTEVARRRMAGTAVAIRLFESDHGRRPASLSELVPEYLAAVPRDPFTLDSELGYQADAPGAMLYSLGPDGTFDGRVTDEEARQSRRNRFDVIFRLGLPADSLEAGDHNAQPEHDQGQQLEQAEQGEGGGRQ